MASGIFTRLSNPFYSPFWFALVLSLFPPPNSLASASPSLVLHSVPNDFFPDPIQPSSNEINLTRLQNFSFPANPLASVTLLKLPSISESKSLLTISSLNDSASENFIIEILNQVKTKQQNLGTTIIYAFLGVTLTNLCSVTGFICIPIKHRSYFKHLLSFMMALAVGALFSTAVLVLLPESMRMIDMPLEFGGQGRTYLFKLGCVLAGALFFYCLEYVLLILPRLLKWKMPSESDSGTDVGDLKKWYEEVNAAKEISNPEISVEEDGALGDINSGSNESVHDVSKLNTRSLGRRKCCCQYFSREKFSQIAPVAWMILFGDGCHNFMDGMTIGAGFTESPVIGIALSLSILFEELPHELGDFAILISSGFSIKSAIVANFLSACSAYLGMILGLIIGEVSTGALYVFAITAGFFFYISLSDMLPGLRETLEQKEKRNESSLWIFIIQVAGLLTGFGCVLGVTLLSDLISF
ncbi:hypothetical protein Aperf_G00000078812 [Anoplocephala perfoliata]